MSLRIVELAKHFGAVKAVDGLTLAVEPGQIVGLMGPNGAGKSTVINLISGVLAPTRGSVLLDDTPIDRWRAYRIADAGVVRTFQTCRLFPELTVEENIRTALPTLWRRRAKGTASRGEKRADGERVASQMAALGLTSARRWEARMLPYAMQRRVEIARALVRGPKYVLLDEPAAGMNEAETSELADVIRGLRRDGLGVVLVEHDVAMVLDLSDHVVVQDFGQAIFDGPASEVRNTSAVRDAYLGSGDA